MSNREVLLSMAVMFMLGFMFHSSMSNSKPTEVRVTQFVGTPQLPIVAPPPPAPAPSPVSYNEKMESDILLLATTMWGEARGEGAGGMRSVGHTIMNRVHDGRWGESVDAVVFQRQQFSVWNENDPNRPAVASTQKNDPNWLIAQQVAREILTGRSIDPTAGRLFYHTASSEPYWKAYGVDPIKLGSHVFYRNVRPRQTGL